MAHLESDRLRRECWLTAADEDRISILCPGCGSSVEADPRETGAPCGACGVVILTAGRFTQFQSISESESCAP
jgi:DNA-directed RNA polymerase subunit RPC12/RpoP